MTRKRYRKLMYALSVKINTTCNAKIDGKKILTFYRDRETKWRQIYGNKIQYDEMWAMLEVARKFAGMR